MGQQVELALRQSIDRVLFTLVNFLPGLLALLFAVIVLAALGGLLAMLIRRVLTSMRFDERVASRQTPGALTNLSEWAPANSPTLLLSRIAFWLCVFAGVAIGISAFDASISDTAQISLVLLPYITQFVGAALILIVGNLLARFFARTVLISAVNSQLQYARFLSLGVKWLVLVLTGAMALDHLRIGGGIVELAFGILFGGIVLTLALAIGLGSRDLVSRSIEKSIDRPIHPVETSPQSHAEQPTPSHFRHF